MTDFITWEILGTLAGAATFVTLTVEVLKNYIGLRTQLVALVVSVLVGVCLQLFVWQDMTAGGWALAACNTLLILAAAIGEYEALIKKLQKNDAK